MILEIESELFLDFSVRGKVAFRRDEGDVRSVALRIAVNDVDPVLKVIVAPLIVYGVAEHDVRYALVLVN